MEMLWRIDGEAQEGKICSTMNNRITPCLWFNGNAEEAARFYVSVFGGESKVTDISSYAEAGKEFHEMEPGSVLMVAFELNGQTFSALNGKSKFPFTQAVSMQIECETQEEVDYYWDTLSEGGDPEAQQCGWLADKYGFLWQVTPTIMVKKFILSPDAAARERAFAAMMGMKKLDIAGLEKAFKGGE
jgi:predicted 3-demethylubiquinone-9 3-methyltransferase (glyoxalase superfamily)